MKFMSWLGQKINSFFDRATQELNQHKTVLCWLYSLAYLVLVRYCVMHNPATMNTAIMTTGGVCGTIFSAWVIGGAHVDATRLKFSKPIKPGTPEDPTDPGF